MVLDAKVMEWATQQGLDTAALKKAKIPIYGKWYFPELPADVPLAVRAWRPGDRMRARAGGTARRVKRFFADARVPGMDRAGWPVVLAAGEIVWIPGVRRSDAATVQPGRPGVRYECDRNDG